MIVITTPTGAIGAQVLQKLIDGPEPVRVIARDPSKLPETVRARVEVVEGSHGDRQILDRALTGADALLWIAPPDPKALNVHVAYVDFTRQAVEAIGRHGVKRIVAISALGRGLPAALEAGLVTASLEMDDLLASTGVALRSLVMPSFMDNLLNQVQPISAQGMFFGPESGDHRKPTVATCDIAATAASFLRDPSWTGQAEVPVLGPEDLSFDDMAAIISEVADKPVRYKQISGEAFTQRLTGFGMTDGMAKGMLEMMMAKQAGLDNGVLRTAETRSPTTFRQWCETVLKPALAA